MIKKIIKSFLLITLLTTAVFLYVAIDKEIIYPLDYFKSEDTKIEEQRARLQLLKDTVNQSAQILQKTIYAIDGNRTTQSIDSKNILYAISNKEIFLAMPAPYIDPKKVPNFKYSIDKVQYVVKKILESPSGQLEQNTKKNKDIRNILWFGGMKTSKLNDGHKLVFVTVKRSILDKALRDPIYKKEFQHYMWNTLNHEAVHMLGGDEYFAAKYGQTLDVNTSSEFFQDNIHENLVLGMLNKYFDNSYSKFSKFIDLLLDSNLKLNNPQKNNIQSMMDTIKKNKKSIFILDKKRKEEQLSTNKRALWVKTHDRTVLNEYYLILTRGERFLTNSIISLNTEYWGSESAGLYFNIYKLLQEKGYSQKDIELFNSVIAKKVLDAKYGYKKTNSIPFVIKGVEHSLNQLVSICFEESGKVDDSLANGILYFNGNLVEKDYKKAKKYLEIASTKGSTRAKTLLAKIYYSGLGTKKDLKKALVLYKELHADNIVGWIYYTGDKSIQNYEKAFYSFYRAANNSNLIGRSNIGLMYFRGQHVQVDYKMALKHFEKAIEHYELADTINNIAWLHLNGLGVKQNTKKALELFEKAADNHSTAAILNIEWIFSTDEFNLKNPQKENYWHKRVKKLKQKDIDENHELTYTTDK